jgi:DNA-binding transcriptional regulator YiaG
MTPTQLRRLRKDLGFTQAKLAEFLGVHAVTVRKWEAGLQGMNTATSRLLRLLALQSKQQQKRPRALRRGNV